MTKIYIVKRCVFDYADNSYDENLYAVKDEQTAQQDVAKLQAEFDDMCKLARELPGRMREVVSELNVDNQCFGSYQDTYEILRKMPNCTADELQVLLKRQRHNNNRTIAVNKAAFEIVSKEYKLTAKQIEYFQFDPLMFPHFLSEDTTFEYEEILLVD